jgi:hypothetical protein
MPDQHHNPPSADSPHDQHVVESLGYEARDIIGQRRSIFYYAALHFAGLVVTGAIVIGIYAFMQSLAPQFDQVEKGVEPIGNEAAELQADPGIDMTEFAKKSEERLHGYGWSDEEKGLVHIPIEKAMEIIAAENLPHRGGSQ